ncbi:glycoside hydrolase family 28 protein [Aplosporella prunicola CBS 121167]|uniref:endo-polygalacturonase n=1 Tax=Aplosporella prunicola CBS 121167 TaxID=1176127 RepID=A0A6A6B5P2_9PEZI|nr:glycoside hydrolase family 28 protein [Aplosporella prunicola CBS 121167]KAF2138743.1 glycoside hydrolase family 28 protein [Aplosporella prunicola CBS 121167]
MGAGVTMAAAMPANMKRADSCTFTDAAAAKEGKADCTSIVLKDITVPAGETLDLSDLADNTQVEFQGTTSFEYDEWEGPLIRFSGTGLTISGAEGHLINGNGAKWWDGKGTNGGKDKPKFFYAHDMKQSTIKGLNIKNTPVQGFSINSSEDLTLDSITIDNTDGDVEDGGHNTDAFDVGSSTGITISNANIKNQDDCLAINSGTNIAFTGGTCSGGHGLSIGSVGGRDDNDVKNVTISDSTVSDSDNGIRIKTVYDATGSVDQVTFSNIKLSNIAKYGIIIEQDYENGSPTGKPTNGISIAGLKVEDITGSVADDASPVQILCGSDSCTDWTWSGVDVTGGEASDECQNVPDVASC